MSGEGNPASLLFRKWLRAGIEVACDGVRTQHGVTPNEVETLIYHSFIAMSPIESDPRRTFDPIEHARKYGRPLLSNFVEKLRFVFSLFYGLG